MSSHSGLSPRSVHEEALNDENEDEEQEFLTTVIQDDPQNEQPNNLQLPFRTQNYGSMRETINQRQVRKLWCEFFTDIIVLQVVFYLM